jgi:hypothetical protein
MGESGDVIWKGERNRQLAVYRPCQCSACSKSSRGVGYLSFSDANGNGFTVWIENEMVFRRLKTALRFVRNGGRNDRPDPCGPKKRPAGGPGDKALRGATRD